MKGSKVNNVAKEFEVLGLEYVRDEDLDSNDVVGCAILADTTLRIDVLWD